MTRKEKQGMFKRSLERNVSKRKSKYLEVEEHRIFPSARMALHIDST